MMIYDPSERFTALEALNHPWIESSCCKEIVSKDSTKSLLNDLRSFNAELKLQQAALTYIVSQLVTNKEKEELQSTFIALDKDKDGRLAKEDLIKGYKEMFGEGFPAEEEVDKIMVKLDIDGSGYIDLTEFIMATINKKKLLSRERLISAFQLFDRVLLLCCDLFKDGSGSISAEEIKQILGASGNIPDELWKDVIMEVDQNGDGEVSLEEFITMMQKILDA